MTVQNQVTKVTALGNGSGTVFSFNPMVLPDKSAQLQVTKVAADGTETLLTEGTGTSNYSVSVVSYPGTGSITYPATLGTKLQTGEKLVMRRLLVLEQETALENQGGYFPEVQELEYDREIMIDLQQQEQIDRSPKFVVSADLTGFDNEIPAPVAGKAPRIKDDKSGWELVDSPADAVTDAAASAAAALASKNAAAASAAASATSATASAGSATSSAGSATAAAASATAAANVLNSVPGRTVVFLTSANSPVAPLQADNGTEYRVDTSGGNVVFNLPSIAGLALPYSLVIKKETSDGNTITLNRASTDLIDGGTSKIIGTVGGAWLNPEASTSPKEWTSADFGASAGSLTYDSGTTAGGSTVALSVSPGAATNVAVFLGGVRQRPGVDYTLSGTTVTFTTAPASGLTWWALSGTTLSIGTPADNTVTNAKLANGTRGAIKYMGAAGWADLPPGTAGQQLQTQGAGADPQWAGPAFTKTFTSADQTITAGGGLTLAHSLGAAPFDVAAYLVCQTGENGYSAGDVLKVDAAGHGEGAASKNIAVTLDATNVNVRFGADAVTFDGIRKDTGAATTFTNGNWKLRIKAWL